MACLKEFSSEAIESNKSLSLLRSPERITLLSCLALLFGLLSTFSVAINCDVHNIYTEYKRW